MIKKNNHYVPRCLIKRWITNNGKYNGVFFLDIKAKSIDFSGSIGKKAFSFASVDNLYILSYDNNRLLNLENWFDGLENSLSKFIDKSTKFETDLFKNDYGQLNKLMMSLVSFEFRSRYFFEKSIEYLKGDNEIKLDFNSKNRTILENVVNGTTDYVNGQFPVELTIWNTDLPMLLCDRPLLLDKIDGYSFFPLTPNTLLTFKKTSGISSICYQRLNNELVHKFNDLIIQNARDWIVANSKDQLDWIVSNKEFSQFNDEIIFNVFKNMKFGYGY